MTQEINFVTLGEYKGCDISAAFGEVLINVSEKKVVKINDLPAVHYVELDNPVVKGARALLITFKNGTRCIVDISELPYKMIRRSLTETQEEAVQNVLVQEYAALPRIVPSQKVQDSMDLERNADEIGKMEEEEKQHTDDIAILDKYGLNFDNYSNDEMNKRNISSIRAVDSFLYGSTAWSTASLLTLNLNERFLIELAKAQVEQNWILMRQNEQIIRELEKLSKG